MHEKQDLIAKLQSIARDLGTPSVPRREFRRHARVSMRRIERLFGSYNELVLAAGLTPRQFPTSDTPIYSDGNLLAEVVRVLRLPNSKLSRAYFEQSAAISSSVCERRFGGWINTLRAAASALDPTADTILLRRIEEYTTPNIGVLKAGNRGVYSSQDGTPSLAPEQKSEEYPLIPSGGTNLYGDFVNFRGLQHAPVNEQGVVFLFGMICRELGYIVEIIKPGFPDCEAKRRVRGKKGMWQRVRIEFEFQSRSFRDHGHDPDKCDVIVCWEDNWPDALIEVLDLRSAVRTLSSKQDGAG